MTEARVFAIDAGGTMTDAFVVLEDGRFAVGKAQTTPDDESEGVLRSFKDAITGLDGDAGAAAAGLIATIYSGTLMLNRLLQREGEGGIGVVTTAGFEDVLRFGRAFQSYAGYPYAERLHARSHGYPEPIVPRSLVRGVRERIHLTGMEMIPVYEEEAREAVGYLLDRGVRAICICFLYSYQNPSHERRVAEIAREVMSERGVDIPLYLSSEQNPVRGELPRLNSLILEVYAARPSRLQLVRMRERLKELGSPAPFRILTSYGGTVSPEHEWLVSTLVSGPIGGIIGGNRLGDHLGIDNLVCADIGGTSFDVGLITEGQHAIRTEWALAQFVLNTPMIAMDSIGAGTGTYVRLDPVIRRINLGPDSAGHRVGVCYEAGGVDTPTVTDCHVVLGYVNPDYFLGGEIQLSAERARQALEEKIAQPLGIEPEEVAWGIIQLLETQMRDHLAAMILGLGYSPENYHLLTYGGGGPLHVAALSHGLQFESVLVPSWAAAFSAYGCACADCAYRYDRTMDQVLPPDGSGHQAVVGRLTSAWREIRERLAEELRRDGLDPGRMVFRPYVRMQYRGMLDDLEIPSPSAEPSREDLDAIIAEYERLFERIFARAAKSAEAGYVVTKAIGVGIVPTEKPRIPELPLQGQDPAKGSMKGRRRIFWDGSWTTADLFEMDRLQPGNVVAGPAVVEAPATTLLVPPGWRAALDKNLIFRVEEV